MNPDALSRDIENLFFRLREEATQLEAAVEWAAEEYDQKHVLDAVAHLQGLQDHQDALEYVKYRLLLLLGKQYFPSEK